MTRRRSRLRPSRGYTERLAAIADQLRPGSVNQVIVRHDDHCDLLHGRGPCNCRPEIEVGELQ
jgi:hypothetical protein